MQHKKNQRAPMRQREIKIRLAFRQQKRFSTMQREKKERTNKNLLNKMKRYNQSACETMNKTCKTNINKTFMYV